MNSKTVRSFLTSFITLFFLCIIWGFALQDKIGENYVTVFFGEPFAIKIPLTICSLGILLGCICGFLENPIKKRFRNTSIIIITLGLIFSLISVLAISIYSNQQENIQNSIELDQKYQIENYANTPMLTKDPSYKNIDSNFIALGKTYAYHTETNYVCKEDDMFSIEISAYEFRNPPRIYTKKIIDHLQKEYFQWITRIIYTDGEVSTGECNGNEYKYYFTTHTGERRNYSYFALLVQKEDSISLLMLKAYYTTDYEISIRNIIQKMC